MRALYRQADGGDLVVGDDDAAFYGMRIVPLGATDWRRWTLPEHRLVEWALTERTLPPAEAAVRQLLGTPQWFLLGDDWGGNYYACDLVPTAAGHTGQIVFIDHETSGGAVLVADSLTDLLAGRLAESVPVERATPRTVMLGGRSNATVIDAADPAVDGLAIGLLTEPVDLSPLAGHPGLRWVTSAVGGAIGDLTVLATLPVVEYLHLHITDWRGLFDADAVPTTLLAARVEAHGAADALGAIEIANELLTRWGQESISVRTVVDRKRSA